MKYFFIIVSLAMFCTSCSNIQRKIYSPTLVNNPSLQAKNDYSLSLAVSVPAGVDLNAGYAITNRLAVIGGLYSYKNNDKEIDYSLFSINQSTASLSYKNKGFHLGAGLFMPISKKMPAAFISFFGGYTKGNFEMRESFYETSPTPVTSPKLNFYKSDLNRWFLQGSFNWYDQFIHQSVIARFNYAGYGNVTTDYTAAEQYSFNFPPFAYPRWSSFLDVSFDTKIFFSKKHLVGLQLSGTTTFRLKRQDFNFHYYPFRMGVGIVLKMPFKIRS